MKRISPGVVNIAFVLLFVLGLVAAEVYLRISGIRPGFIYTGVTEVDSLIVKPFYYADDSGVQKLTPYATNYINNYVQGNQKFLLKDFEKIGLEDDLVWLTADFYAMKHNLKPDDVEKIKKENGIESSAEEVADFNKKVLSSEFGQKIKKLFAEKEHSAFDSTLLEYVKRPLNNEGFRSLPFAAQLPGKKKILLLGNSFSWGRTATPLYNSFADILLARGYLVINTGIVSTDPAQYVAVMNEYFDSIKPDIVVIAFSINDKMPCLKNAVAGHMQYHHTNAGLLSAWPQGYYMEPKDVYEYELEASKIPLTTTFNRFCALTATGTKLWIAMNNRNMVRNSNPKLEPYNKKAVKDAAFPVSEYYLSQIEAKCKQRNLPMVLVAIPDFFHFYDHYPNLTYPQLFANRNYFEPRNMVKEDYIGESGDDHMNNSGHKKYADYMQTVLDSVMKKMAN